MVVEANDIATRVLPAVWRAEDLLAHPDDKFPDPPPRGDMQQEYNVHDSETMLRAWFEDEDVLVTAYAYLCITTRPPGDTRTVLPDCLVAFDLTREQLMATRNGYVISEVGKPPEFVLEVASATTGVADYTRKRDIYMDFRVSEIFRFDATGGLYHDAALAGDRLVDGEYVSLPLFGCPVYVDDEALHIHSEVLGLDICWREGVLRYYDPVGEVHFRNLNEAEAARRAAEARAEAAEARADDAETRAEAAEARADDAEPEARRLREELRRLRGE